MSTRLGLAAEAPNAVKVSRSSLTQAPDNRVMKGGLVTVYERRLSIYGAVGEQRLCAGTVYSRYHEKHISLPGVDEPENRALVAE